MEENPKEEVLIARDNETGQVGAVVGQNPDGTPKMADVKSTPLSELIKFTKGQNPIEAFIANFMRQAKNPTTFGIFKMSATDYEALGQPMAKMLNDPETNREMLDKYRVKMKTPAAKIKPVDPDKVNWAEIEKQWGVSRRILKSPARSNRWFTITSRRNSIKSTPPTEAAKSWTHACHSVPIPTAHIRSRHISSGRTVA